MTGKPHFFFSYLVQIIAKLPVIRGRWELNGIHTESIVCLGEVSEGSGALAAIVQQEQSLGNYLNIEQIGTGYWTGLCNSRDW